MKLEYNEGFVYVTKTDFEDLKNLDDNITYFVNISIKNVDDLFYLFANLNCNNINMMIDMLANMENSLNIEKIIEKNRNLYKELEYLIRINGYDCFNTSCFLGNLYMVKYIINNFIINTYSLELGMLFAIRNKQTHIIDFLLTQNIDIIFFDNIFINELLKNKDLENLKKLIETNKIILNDINFKFAIRNYDEIIFNYLLSIQKPSQKIIEYIRKNKLFDIIEKI